MSTTAFITILLAAAYYALVIGIFFRIMLENRNPLKTQSWLLVLVLLPVTGLVIYLFFGENLRRKKLFNRKAITERAIVANWIRNYEQRLTQNREVAERYLQEKYKLPFLFFRNASAIFTDRNRVEILRNGEEKFPVLLRALESARHHIHLEYYIFIDDDVGSRIIDLLCRKAAEGVSVRLIIDSIGSSRLSDRAIRRMRKDGVQVMSYNPVLFTSLANKVNYRDHRKIAIIDGHIGLLGGINVSDYYINKPGKRDYWRDTHCKIEGEAVYYLQVLFLLNWHFVSGELIEPTLRYLPPVETTGPGVPTMIVESSPYTDHQNMMEAYFSMITNARREILIATPYFIPNESIMTALTTSAKSGLRVMLLLPERSDTPFVHAASLSFVPELLENDVQVYLYRKGMVHSKVVIVDGEIATLGTANMDYRSFDNNAEVNAFFFDRGVSRLLRAHFFQDIDASLRMDLQAWASRSWKEKLVGSAARLLAPLL